MDLLHLSNHASITCYVPGKLVLWLAKAMWISFYHRLRLCVMAAGFSSWRDPWDHLGGSLPHLHSISYTWPCSVVKTCRAFLAFRIKAEGPTVVSGIFPDLPPHFIFVISCSPTRILAFLLFLEPTGLILPQDLVVFSVRHGLSQRTEWQDPSFPSDL